MPSGPLVGIVDPVRGVLRDVEQLDGRVRIDVVAPDGETGDRGDPLEDVALRGQIVNAARRRRGLSALSPATDPSTLGDLLLGPEHVL